MSTDIERLELRMEANMTQINRAISKLNRDTAASSRDVARRYSEAGRRVEQTFQRMQRAATAALGAIGVGLSTRALTGLITDSLQAAENLADLSNQINANVEGLQTLRFAVDQNGGSADLLDRGLRRLAEGMGRVLAGETNEATRAMERLGLAQRIQSGEIQTTDQLFRVLADALRGVTTQQERAALASQIFGQRLGVQLSQSLSLGSDGLQQFEERLRAAGGVLGEDVVAQGAAANAKLRELHQILATQLQGAVLQNAGELEVMATQLAAIAAGALNATSQIARLIQRLDELGQRSFAGSNLGRYLDTPAGRGLINAIGNNPSLNPIGALGLGLESLENASTGGPQPPSPERRTSGIPFAPEFDGFGPPPAPSPGSPPAASAPIRPVPAFPPEADAPDPLAWVEAARAYQEQLDGMAEKTRQMAKGAQDAGFEFDRFNLTLETVALSGIRNLEQALVDFVTTGEVSFDNLFRQILAGIARMAIQQTIGGPLQSAMGGMFSFGGGKAAGGAVRPGTAYRVGERGAETFVPNVSGVVVPNTERVTGASRSSQVQVIQQFHLHAEGAVMTDDLLKQMDAKAQSASAGAVEAARQIVPNDIGRSQRHTLGR